MPRKNKPQKHEPFVMLANCQQKRRFTTEQLAQTAADDGMLRNMSLSLSTYKCDQCTGWHLTSVAPTKHPR